jgi:hypothetical protein
MATTPNRNTAGTRSPRAHKSQQGFVYLPLIAGWLVPGRALLLRKWYRGALLMVSIVGMFALGSPCRASSTQRQRRPRSARIGRRSRQRPDVLRQPRVWLAPTVQVTVADWGSRFIVVAGMLNVIAAVDAHNLRTGRKAL